MTYKIAFVDDEQNVLESLKWVFKDEPYDINTFNNPHDFLKKIESDDFALVVADQVMPEIEGIKLLQMVKNKHPLTVCIIMTAHADLKIAINAMNQGNIFRFVFKPWDVVELKTAVRNAIDLYELKSEIRRLWQITKTQNERLTYLNKKLKVKVDEQSEEIRHTEEERKRLELQLIQARKIEAMGTLASGIAHDFNNILSAIMGYSEVAVLLADDNSRVKGVINKVLDACERARSLIDQILSFSRQNYQSSDEEVMGIESIIKEVVKLLKASLPENIVIRENLQDNPGVIKASPVKIHQVIMNLCTNSIHAMKKSGGILSIDLDTTELDISGALLNDNIQPGSYIRLSIRDTGSGIPKSTMEKIFDPYFTTKEKGEGTGLGLSVVHGIIKNYKGTISVSSTPDKETTFTVLLPLLKATL